MKKVIFVIEILVLIFLLYWHFKLGLVRYFDADEFAHLHWGYSFSIGEKPYTDFFYLFPPFFLYPIAAVFKIFGRSISAIIVARMFIYVVFLATCSVLFLLAKRLRGISFALFTVIIFAFLPLPFDKLIEVRPDLIATMFSLLGMYLFIKRDKGDIGDKSDKGNWGNKGKYFFLSGLSYAVSLGFVPKTIFFLIPPLLVLGVSYLRSLSLPAQAGRLSHDKSERKNLFNFGLGILSVGVLIILIALSFGNLSLSIYSMSKMASEVTKTLGVKFYMRPDIFFYPNDTYYGLGGWSWSLIINLIIYISASIWAIHKLISLGSSTWKESLGHLPGVLDSSTGLKASSEFLIAGSFWANLIAFVYIYPLKHAQYLIPIAPFIAFYFGDGLFALKESFLKLMRPHEFMKLAGEVFIGLIIALLVIVGWQMNQKKEQWVNKPTFDKINNFLKIIPADAAVWDLTGESIFFKNGYYFCCLPYGQYEEALYFKIPDLEKELEKRGTKYVYLGQGDRLNQIPLPQANYIKNNFIPIDGDKTLLVRK